MKGDVKQTTNIYTRIYKLTYKTESRTVRAAQTRTSCYSPVREAEGDGVDNPERLLHHVTEVEPRHELLLPGRASPGMCCKHAT